MWIWPKGQATSASWLSGLARKTFDAELAGSIRHPPISTISRNSRRLTVPAANTVTVRVAMVDNNKSQIAEDANGLLVRVAPLDGSLQVYVPTH